MVPSEYLSIYCRSSVVGLANISDNSNTHLNLRKRFHAGVNYA